jgi:hypothetical protein
MIGLAWLGRVLISGDIRSPQRTVDGARPPTRRRADPESTTAVACTPIEQRLVETVAAITARAAVDPALRSAAQERC